jgi:hypothetical protein
MHAPTAIELRGRKIAALFCEKETVMMRKGLVSIVVVSLLTTISASAAAQNPKDSKGDVRVVNTAAEPVPVMVGGTPTVNVGNTPTVNVAGTPTVNVGTLPAVSLSGTPTVNIGNTPTVTLAGTPTVSLGFQAEPFSAAAALNSGGNSGCGGNTINAATVALFVVPAGKNAVVEHASASYETPPQRAPRVSLNTGDPNNFSFTYLAMMQAGVEANPFFSVNVQFASHSVRIYALAGTTIYAQHYINAHSGINEGCTHGTVTITGYLVPAP